jgi:hypothetical protein
MNNKNANNIILKNNFVVKSGRGFIATVAILIIAISASLVAMNVRLAANTFNDSVSQKALRIKVRELLEKCKERSVQIVASDYFTEGSQEVPELSCWLDVSNVTEHYKNLNVRIELGGVKASFTGMVALE